jgi:alpha-D-xyloside xylohydrolase
VAPVARTGPPVRASAGTWELPTGDGPLRVTALAAGVRLRLGAGPRPVYPILAGEPSERAATLVERDGAAVLTWDEFTLTLGARPLSFRLERLGQAVQRSPGDGHFAREFRLPPFARLDGGWLAAFELASGERVYGLGEKWGPLDKRGQLVRSLIFDALGVNGERSYKNCPLAWSPRGWAVFLHTPAPVTHAVGYPLWSQRAYVAAVEDDELDVFVLAASGPAEILRRYTDLTGRAAVPPLWSLGAILSRAYYRTADEILATAREVRARRMPCDTITFDGRAWQDTETRFHFGWDPRRYPDVRPVLAELKALGFRICVWEYPLVSLRSPHYAELAERGYLLKDRRTGGPYVYRFDPEPFGPVLTQLPPSGLVDFTNPDACRWWKDAHRALFDLGVDMIKSDFGEQVESDDIVAANGDTGHRLRNVYPLLYNQCVHDAATSYARDGAFLFQRAGWAGSHRIPSAWGGDPQADYEGLAASIRGALAWGLSGGPYFATDIGGFYRDARDPELYARWAQAGVFAAHMRFHGVGPREPWSYGPHAEAVVLAALRWRYRLIPYLWATMREAAATGLPLQRAMVLAFPDDPAAHAFDTQFMLGPDLLVVPCLAAGGRVTGYLPPGRWRRFPDGGAPLAGGRVFAEDLRLERWAVFARDGAELPLGPDVQHVGELGGEPRIETIWR